MGKEQCPTPKFKKRDVDRFLKETDETKQKEQVTSNRQPRAKRVASAAERANSRKTKKQKKTMMQTVTGKGKCHLWV